MRGEKVDNLMEKTVAKKTKTEIRFGTGTVMGMKNEIQGRAESVIRIMREMDREREAEKEIGVTSSRIECRGEEKGKKIRREEEKGRGKEEGGVEGAALDAMSELEYLIQPDRYCKPLLHLLLMTTPSSFPTASPSLSSSPSSHPSSSSSSSSSFSSSSS